jgi:hypothetical protein
LYGLSTTNEQIELDYLLNGSNNGHDPYLARGPWEKASPWIMEKGPACAMSTSDSSLHRRLGSSAAPRSVGEGAAATLTPRSAALRRQDRRGSAALVSRVGTGREHCAIAAHQEITTPSSGGTLHESDGGSATYRVRPLPPPDPSSAVPPRFIQVSRLFSLCSHEFRVDSAPILAGIPRPLCKFDLFG